MECADACGAVFERAELYCLGPEFHEVYNCFGRGRQRAFAALFAKAGKLPIVVAVAAQRGWRVGALELF